MDARGYEFGVSVEAVHEAAQIGEGVKQASTKQIVNLARRLLESAEPGHAGTACWSLAAPNAKTVEKTCCRAGACVPRAPGPLRP